MSHPGPVPASAPRPERRSGATVSLPSRTHPERPEVPAREPRPRRRAFKAFVLLLVAICLVGWPYYALPMAQRVRSPLHPWLKASGYVGQSAGLLALVIFLFLWLYPLRKKYRSLAFTGTIARWLDVHVLAALALPLLVAIHAAWRFAGLIGLGFWCMMVVWLSGVAGRYIYARIPRSKLGVELTIEEIVTRRKELLLELARSSGLDVRVVETTLAAGQAPAGRRGVWVTGWRMIADDLARRRAARALRRLWETRGPRRRKNDREMLRAMLRLARREMALAQQARMLDATHDVFRYWHVLHRPVAVAALIAILVHVAVVVALGATWLW
jgi:dihydropyrimidine dehydrogenase (NAD+) subunit PreT